MDYGSRFIQIRKEAGLSQAEASKLLGIKPYALCNYETNRSEPDIDMLKKMASVYEVDLEELVGTYRSKEDAKEDIELMISSFLDDVEPEDRAEVVDHAIAVLNEMKL